VFSIWVLGFNFGDFGSSGDFGNPFQSALIPGKSFAFLRASVVKIGF
jgi:hypothetical protein